MLPARTKLAAVPQPLREPAVQVDLSVVIPAHDEAGNIDFLLQEVLAALRGRIDFEVVVVDDASRDGTLDVLQAAMARMPELRLIQHQRQGGQSAAIRSGVRAARGAWIATLDGDGQNDPADIPRLLDARAGADPDCKLFGGWRIERRDSLSKRLASRLANAIRRRLLRDDTPDTGCGIKLFEREAFLDLPYFDHMHRYLPALMQRAGWRTASVPVSHRERTAGRSKYGNWGRFWVGLADLRGVAWLIRRSHRPRPREIERPRE
jgi:dolichol-phosphate mannosyltransferase